MASNLDALVRRDGPLVCELAVRYLVDIARQLGDSDRRKVYDLDVRPSNIVVTESGSARLQVPTRSIAEIESSSVALPINRVAPHLQHEFAVEPLSEVSERDLWETADYLAPERALNSARVDERTLIYSLGCVLYFMLTGRPPFASGSISERLMQHQVARPEPVTSLRPDLPVVVSQICDRMLAKKPDERYTSIAELISGFSNCAID